MGDQQPVNVDSLKYAVQNDGDFLILKDKNSGKLIVTKEKLDGNAEEGFFSLFKEHKEEIIKAKNEIHQLQQQLQNIQRNNKEIEANIKIYYFHAKEWQKKENYNGFLSVRNVGVQYPPKKIYKRL